MPPGPQEAELSLYLGLLIFQVSHYEISLPIIPLQFANILWWSWTEMRYVTAVHLKAYRTKWIVLSFCPPRQTVTSSADWPLSLSTAPATPSSTPGATWQLRRPGGQRSLWIVSGHRRWLKSLWVAQMSAGFMKCHQESFQAAGKVCPHCGVCVNYIFVLLCVQHEEGMPVVRAQPLPSIEWKHILWCHTTLDLLLWSAMWWCHSASWLVRMCHCS